MTLDGFLTARLAEDEAAAHEADRAAGWAAVGGRSSPVDWHRMLREVEAKRAILTACERMQQLGGGAGKWGYQIEIDLAAVYSDHPDFDPAWRP